MTNTQPPAAAAPGKPRKPLDLPGILARRALLVLLLGLPLGLVIAPIARQFGGLSYRTEGVLLIDPGKEPTVNGRERETIPGNVGDYTRTLLNRLTAGDVLTAALAAVPTTNWPAFLRADQPPEMQFVRLFKALKVKEVPRTYLMTVEITGEAPRGLAATLNAVMETFLVKLRGEQERQYARRLAYLREERAQLVERIAAERAHLLELAAHVPNKAFLHESYTVHLSKLEQIQRLYWEAEAQRAEREGDWRRTEANRRDIVTLSLQPYADERVADNFGINRIEQWTYEQLQSLRSTIDGLTTNNGDRTYVEMRMTAMNDYLEQYKRQVNDLTSRLLREKREYDLTAAMLLASNAHAAAVFTRDSLGQRLETARQEATETSEAIFRATEPGFTVNQLRERLTALNNRIDDCEMEAKSPLRLSIDRPAGEPTRPATDTRDRFGAIGLLAAFGVVLAGILVFELLDDRIRGPAEARAAIGGPAPDPVPFLATGTPERILTEQPDSVAGVAIRALAARLNRERARHGARLFVFAGLGHGAGASTLALQTAHALACLTPRVCLLRLDGAPGAPSELLRDPAGCEAAIERDATRALFRLTIAPPPPGAAAARIGLPDLLARLKAAHDVVILDAGSLPGDDLACAALGGAHAVVLIAREDITLYRDARRAIELVVAAGVPAFTLWLNATHRPLAGRLQARVQHELARVTRLHRRVADECRRRLARGRGPAGGRA